MYYTNITINSRDEVDSQVAVDFNEALANEQEDLPPSIEPLACQPPKRDSVSFLCRAPCYDEDCISDGEWASESFAGNLASTLLREGSPRPPSWVLSACLLGDTTPST